MLFAKLQACAAQSVRTTASSSASSANAGCAPGRLRFGLVGTSIITENFVNAAREVAGVELTSLYSRTESKASDFASKFPDVKFNLFTNLSAMASSSDVDAVYIASPTSEHAKQSIVFLSHGKHVFCEKPACSHSRELEAVLACATQHGVAFMEGMRSLRSPNFSLFQEEVAKLGPVRHLTSTVCQLSSKWPAYLRGERPSAFLPELSNGALMDIGCYGIHVAVALLGPPQKVSYTAVMLETGVDGAGVLVLDYGDKVATIHVSKMSQGYNRTEVQTENGAVSVDSPLEFTDVIEHSPSGGQRLLSKPEEGQASDLGARGGTRWAGSMRHEVVAFIEFIQNGSLQDPVISWAQSRAVMKVLDEGRRQAAIHYPADSADL